MSHIPDKDFKYICHVRDHFSRFSWARALASKRASEVALYLFEIFTTFGPPLILHSDNGKEFVADVIFELLKLWPEIKVVNGRPRHPQSQGCVECGNKILEERLAKWMATNKNASWSMGLPLVVCKYYVIFSAYMFFYVL
jgi:transposase InsO family protein